MQAALREDGLDGWLLYDFKGLNPIATRLSGLAGSRRDGDAAVVLPHPARRRAAQAGSRHRAPQSRAPARRHHASTPGATALEPGLSTLLAGVRRVAMEYSPDCAIPYLSRVDAGTIDLLRARGARRRLLGRPGAALRSGLGRRRSWPRTGTPRCVSIASRIAPSTFVREALAAGRALTEMDVQDVMVQAFADEGLISDSAPVVGAQENAGNPHYLPTVARAPRTSARNEVLLLDLWGKLDRRRAPSSPTSRGWASPGRAIPEHGRSAPGSPSRAPATPPPRSSSDGARAGPRPARLAGGPRGASGAARCRLRRPHPAPHRSQPRERGARQRRPHGRLRDARRSAADSGHGVHHRAGALFRHLRPAHRDQHDRRRAARRASPDRSSATS